MTDGSARYHADVSLTLEQHCRSLLEELSLVEPGDLMDVVPLTGGVASDIAAVHLAERRVCVKFALGRLRVSEEWLAPVQRNHTEYCWLQAAAGCAPASVPELFGCSREQHGFVMEYLHGDGIYGWKQALLDEAPDRGEALRVAGALGRIHAASTSADFDRSVFASRNDFHALRIEPYLLHTAGQHPTVADSLQALAAALSANDTALVHGDVSPKNIMIRHGEPVLLDAECATMGDPAFDVAFCLNHLVLKAVHLPASRARLLDSVNVFWREYCKHVTWEQSESLEARVAGLLPALMLARIDGKSPVEYLDDAQRALTRSLALTLIRHPIETIATLIASVSASLDVRAGWTPTGESA